jgi:hypothetical protein
MASFSDRLRDLSPVWNEKSGGEDDLDSLPSMSTSDIYSDADSEAQEEWERSLEQLQLLLTMMVIPFVGKYFGRKFAYWSTSGTCACMESIANPRLQVGANTWRGFTALKYALRTRRPSRPSVLQKRHPACDKIMSGRTRCYHKPPVEARQDCELS